MRARIDSQIKKLFYAMKERGVTQTIQASLTEAYEVFNLDMTYPKSAREAELMQARERRQKRENIMKERQAYYARQKYAANPHIRLMIKQLERSGD